MQFLKVFTTVMSFELFVEFMDTYLLAADPSFFIFFIVSFITSMRLAALCFLIRRNVVLKQLAEKALETISNFVIDSKKTLKMLINRGKVISGKTPSSVKLIEFHKVVFQKANILCHEQYAALQKLGV